MTWKKTWAHHPIDDGIRRRASLIPPPEHRAQSAGADPFQSERLPTACRIILRFPRDIGPRSMRFRGNNNKNMTLKRSPPPGALLAFYTEAPEDRGSIVFPLPAVPACMRMRESRRIRMGNKPVRMFIGAVLVAVLGMFGTAARAIPVSLAFDPPFTFEGILTLDVGPTCLGTNGVHSCLIDYLSVDFTDVSGNHWVTGTPLLGQTNLVDVVGGAFFGLQVTLGSPFLALAGDGNGCDGQQQLMFELPNSDNDNVRSVSFTCGNNVGDNVGTYRVVPEPGTLALLGLGLAGIARARRRHAR